MARRQSIPERWLIVADRLDRAGLEFLRRLPRGSGVLLLQPSNSPTARALRTIAVGRDLTVAIEAPSTAGRVHSMRELTQARLRRTPLILISPVYPTPSHPNWEPLRRMRAAALARLAGRSPVALGGMNEKRFRSVQTLGFVAWAGIGAWRKVTKVMR